MHFCAHCDYKSARQTNLKRHVSAKHLKIKVTCDCGMILNEDTLYRHRNEACPLTRNIETTSSNIKKIKVAMTVQIETLANGNISVLSETVNVAGIPMTLVPILQNGKKFKCN